MFSWMKDTFRKVFGSEPVQAPVPLATSLPEPEPTPPESYDVMVNNHEAARLREEREEREERDTRERDAERPDDDDFRDARPYVPPFLYEVSLVDITPKKKRKKAKKEKPKAKKKKKVSAKKKPKKRKTTT